MGFLRVFTRGMSSGLAGLGRKMFHKEGLEDSSLKNDPLMCVCTGDRTADKNGILIGVSPTPLPRGRQSWMKSPVCQDQ